MAGILSSIQNLIQSILDIFASLFNTLLSAFQGVFAVLATVITNIGELAKGFVELVLGNIVIIGVVIAGLVGYSAYQQRRGGDTRAAGLTKKTS